MPMSFIISMNVEHSLEKTPREFMERFNDDNDNDNDINVQKH